MKLRTHKEITTVLKKIMACSSRDYNSILSNVKHFENDYPKILLQYNKESKEKLTTEERLFPFIEIADNYFEINKNRMHENHNRKTIIAASFISLVYPYVKEKDWYPIFKDKPESYLKLLFLLGEYKLIPESVSASLLPRIKDNSIEKRYVEDIFFNEFFESEELNIILMDKIEHNAFALSIGDTFLSDYMEYSEYYYESNFYQEKLKIGNAFSVGYDRYYGVVFIHKKESKKQDYFPRNKSYLYYIEKLMKQNKGLYIVYQSYALGSCTNNQEKHLVFPEDTPDLNRERIIKSNRKHFDSDIKHFYEGKLKRKDNFNKLRRRITTKFLKAILWLLKSNIIYKKLVDLISADDPKFNYIEVLFEDNNMSFNLNDMLKLDSFLKRNLNNLENKNRTISVDTLEMYYMENKT